MKPQLKDPSEAMVESVHVTAAVPRVTVTFPAAVKPSPVTVSLAPAAAEPVMTDMLGSTVKITGAPVELVEAETEEVSLAVTLYGLPPADRAGMLNPQLKEPFEPTVELVHATAAVPSVTVMVPDGVKPWPVTVSFVPTAAAVEEMEMLAGAVDELEVDVVEVVWALASGTAPTRTNPSTAINEMVSAARERLVELERGLRNSQPSFGVTLR